MKMNLVSFFTMHSGFSLSKLVKYSNSRFFSLLTDPALVDNFCYLFEVSVTGLLRYCWFKLDCPQTGTTGFDYFYGKAIYAKCG